MNFPAGPHSDRRVSASKTHLIWAQRSDGLCRKWVSANFLSRHRMLGAKRLPCGRCCLSSNGCCHKHNHLRGMRTKQLGNLVLSFLAMFFVFTVGLESFLFWGWFATNIGQRIPTISRIYVVDKPCATMRLILRMSL